MVREGGKVRDFCVCFILDAWLPNKNMPVDWIEQSTSSCAGNHHALRVTRSTTELNGLKYVTQTAFMM
jgi:hypothetical protein